MIVDEHQAFAEEPEEGEETPEEQGPDTELVEGEAEPSEPWDRGGNGGEALPGDDSGVDSPPPPEVDEGEPWDR